MAEMRNQLELLLPAFYERPTPVVARDLIGRYLVMTRPGQPDRVGRVVETEAYVGEQDRASHSARGLTPRNAAMFEAAGHAYVYFVYGMHWCLNVVSEGVGHGCAVLLRAAEPLSGIEGSASGPGRLCRAFGIDGTWNRADLTNGPLTIRRGRPVPDSDVATAPRVGVAYAGEWAAEPLRFYLASSSSVSARRRSASRTPASGRALASAHLG